MFKKVLFFLFFPVCLMLPHSKAAAQTADSLHYDFFVKKFQEFSSRGNFDSALYCLGQCQYIADSSTFGQSKPFLSVIIHYSAALTYLFKSQITLSLLHSNYAVTKITALIAKGDTSRLAGYYYGQALYMRILGFQFAGAYTAAAPFINQYIAENKYLRDTGALFTARYLLAVNYGSLGQYGAALLLYDSLLAQFAQAKAQQIRVTSISDVYSDMAVIYSQTDNPRKALFFKKLGMNICCTEEKINQGGTISLHDDIPLLIDFADSYRTLHYYDSALQVLSTIEEKTRAIPLFAANYAYLLQEKAAIYQNKGMPSQALKLYAQAQHITDTLSDNQANPANAMLLNQAALYQQLKMYGPAAVIYKQQSAYLYNQGLAKTYQMQQVLAGLCKNLLLQNKNHEAADSLLKAASLALVVLDENFTGMPESDKMQYAAAFSDVFDMIYTLLAKDNKIGSQVISLAFKLQLQQKNMVLNSQANMLTGLRTTADSITENLYAAWLTTRQMLAKQYSLPYGDRFLNKDSLEQLSESLERRLSAHGYQPKKATGEELVNKFLQQLPTAANIEFVRYNDAFGETEDAAYGAFVLRGGSSHPVFVKLCSEKALTALMKIGSRQLKNEQPVAKFYNSYAYEARKLYGLIWQPLEKYLYGATVVNYSPAGLLDDISFAALTTETGFLGERYGMRRFYSITKAAEEQKKAAVALTNVSLWGDMDYNSANYTDSTTLPAAVPDFLNNGGLRPAAQSKNISKTPLANFAASELLAVKNILAQKKVAWQAYETSDATEERFKQTASQIQGVLHISTHGFYTPYNKNEAAGKLPGDFIAGNENPLFRCGLAFAGANHYWMKGQPLPGHDDGILTGYEISQLDLHNVQLVTLSACETGLGDITATEGNLGLQRAFKLAGVQNLLVSLWQVPAKQTARLLAKFYSHWLDGAPPARALQAAQKELRDEGRTPYEWAGFVLVE